MDCLKRRVQIRVGDRGQFNKVRVSCHNAGEQAFPGPRPEWREVCPLVRFASNPIALSRRTPQRVAVSTVTGEPSERKAKNGLPALQNTGTTRLARQC